jgi:hypothetical protein
MISLKLKPDTFERGISIKGPFEKFKNGRRSCKFKVGKVVSKIVVFVSSEMTSAILIVSWLSSEMSS